MLALLITLFFFLSAGLFGTTLLLRTRSIHEQGSGIMGGTILGLIITITALWLSRLLIATSPLIIISVLCLEIAFSLFLWQRRKLFSRWRKLPLDYVAVIIFIFLLVLTSVVVPKLFISQTDGIHTGIINAFGDLPFHISIITNQAEQHTFIPENPIFASRRLVYPFLTDFFSSLLTILSMPLISATILPAIILIPTIFTLLYHLTHQLTKNKLAGVIAILLVLFAGSVFGWTQLGSDLATTANYTGHSNHSSQFHFINPLISLLLPQRAFIFALPIALTILLLLVQTNRSISSFILAGIMAGLLPLFHAHTVLALIPAIFLLVVLRPSRAWLAFFIITAAIGLPEVFYYLTNQAATSTIPTRQLGWMAQDTNLILYWFKNTGLLIPVSLAGLFIKATQPTRALTLAGLIIFIVTNIWLFARWEWDNTKLLIYWLFFTAPAVALILARLIQSKQIALPAIAIIFIFVHTFSGILDVTKLTLPHAPTWRLWTNQDINMAKAIKQHTNPGDIILTAPIHNSLVNLAGRPIYLGYPGHAWSHGLDYTDRAATLNDLYTGRKTSLSHHQPTFALFSPSEQQYFNVSTLNQPTWPLIIQSDQYQLFKVDLSRQ